MATQGHPAWIHRQPSLFDRGQFQGQPHENRPGQAIHDHLGARRPVEPAADGAGQKGDAAEDQDRRNDENPAQKKHLQGQRATGRIGELGQEGQEKDRHLGVGDVHDDAAPIKPAIAQFAALAGGDGFRRGAENPPGQVEKIAGADQLQGGEGQGRGLEDRRHAKGHGRGVNDQAGAQPQGHQQAGQLAP
ncbi:hypothetical protein DESC_710097 [Desulfosarcina cetonica]|nr:hypothetical protein DESC_710097 [Desulfosarcina cetonica]